DSRLAGNGSLGSRTTPLLFSRDFVARVHGSVEAGRLSLGKAMRLLDLSGPEFAALCQACGLDLSYEV
ncbi:MAG: hypothetical protein KAJ42_09645, partial [Gemmatimonadetes bacterium]|nr:hypothetical protein [Gemmatimonadota bacterium]